jgi:hypothetical protein
VVAFVFVKLIHKLFQELSQAVRVAQLPAELV